MKQLFQLGKNLLPPVVGAFCPCFVNAAMFAVRFRLAFLIPRTAFRRPFGQITAAARIIVMGTPPRNMPWFLHFVSPPFPIPAQTAHCTDYG